MNQIENHRERNEKVSPLGLASIFIDSLMLQLPGKWSLAKLAWR